MQQVSKNGKNITMCKICGNTLFEVFNDWEWRKFRFHCSIMCVKCACTTHAFALTKKRAVKKCVNYLNKGETAK